MTIPSTMRALQQTSLNGPRDLRLITDAPVPRPGAGEILIRVTAAGVNFGDLLQARGLFPGGPQPPYLAGFEAAGAIVAVGEDVTGPQPGAHVIGANIVGGAFAEYLVLPAAAAVPVPTGWTDEQALGLVVSWPTALAALRPLGRIAAGQTVLIHAAAGATGQVAVRMAKHYGATVIATRLAGQARHAAGTGRRPHPRLPKPRHRRRGPAADRRHRRRPGTGVSGRRYLRRQPGRDQAGHRPGRRLRHDGRRRRDH
jgi:NADPH2:quinone reductase